MTTAGVPDEVRRYIDTEYRGAALARFEYGGDQVRMLVRLGQEPLVVKWFSLSERRGQDLAASASLAKHLSSLGWPFARLVAIGETAHWSYLVETHIDGHHPSAISHEVMMQLMRLVLSARSSVEPVTDWLPFLVDQLENGGPKIDVHTLASHAQGSEVLATARNVAEGFSKEHVFTDIIHGDFSPGNALLTEDGSLVGIVDWDAVRVGDAAFDLTALEWDIELWGRSVRQSLPSLWSRLRVVSSPALIQLYRYYHTCANLSWAIGTNHEASALSASQAVLRPDR